MSSAPASSSSESSSSSSAASIIFTIQELEAGVCHVDGIANESSNGGFSGTGYINTTNAQGAAIHWAVDASESSTYQLSIRFANGGTSNRDGALVINGGSNGNYTLNLPTTGAWNNWQTLELTIDLVQGENSLVLSGLTSDGLANIDFIRLEGAATQAGTCPAMSSSSVAASSVASSSASSAAPIASGPTLAFPGAQGFGRFATGGRGGEVVRVTNLNDSGAGSLRDAISKPNRIVVFDVSGVIKLNTRLVFKNNQTIAGQTAPGKGISIYGNGVSFSGASNTIVRYVRFRMGRIGDSGKDTVAIANGNNIIFDNVSLSWGRDGTFDLNQESGARLYNITLQDSIVAQGLQTHSTGGLINTTGTSIIRSLYIDNNSRNPKARGTLQFVNNVIYNWVTSGYILGDTTGRSDGAMLGNYFITGPETKGGTLDSPGPAYNLYAVDNWYDSNKDGALNGRLLGKGDYGTVTWWTSPSVEFPPVPVLSATAALQYVIANAGASHQRDEVDDYVIDELKSYGKKGKTISNETSLGIVNVVGNFPAASAPKDTDRDGIPDAWEIQHGLNPNNAADAMLDRNGDGWVNIEEYINSLVP